MHQKDTGSVLKVSSTVAIFGDLVELMILGISRDATSGSAGETSSRSEDQHNIFHAGFGDLSPSGLTKHRAADLLSLATQHCNLGAEVIIQICAVLLF